MHDKWIKVFIKSNCLCNKIKRNNETESSIAPILIMTLKVLSILEVTVVSLALLYLASVIVDIPASNSYEGRVVVALPFFNCLQFSSLNSIERTFSSF